MLKLLTDHLKHPFKALLMNMLGNTKGNQSKAARELGISRGALRKYIKYFAIESTSAKVTNCGKEDDDLRERRRLRNSFLGND